MYHNCVRWVLAFVLLSAGRAWSDSLVAHWKFNEGTGSTAYDSSVNNNTGALHNMAEDDWVSGLDGTALNFDGSDDYVQVADDSSMSFGTGSFSIAVWMKADAGGRILINGSSGGSLSGKRYVLKRSISF